MAVIQALLALVTRSLGRIMSAMFGWAVTALFGQTSPSEQTILSALVGAAAAWPVLLLGIAMPKIAVFVLGFVPLPEWVPKWVVRLIWIALAAAIPLAVGLTMALRHRRGRTLSRADAPATQEPAIVRLLRGFPTTLGIAAAFFVMFVTVPALRLTSLVRRRVDVQVPLVTDREHYDHVAEEIARVLALHGFTVARAEPGWWMTVPSRILLALGGPAFRDQIPERLAYFRGDRLEVALYPNGLLLRGNAQDTAWAHGIVVEELTEAPALQTFDPRAQEIERQIRRVWSLFRENPAAHRHSSVLEKRLDEICTEIGRAPISYDEWQIVYRQAMQLGRALDGEMQLMAATSSNHRAGVDARAVQEDQMRSYSTSSSARELSNRELLGEITGTASMLVRKEIELAKAELRADFKAQLSMVAMLAVAAVIALVGVNILVVAGVLALGLVMAGWLAGVIVAFVLLAVAGILGYIGSRRIVTNPLAVTRQSLKEDVRWVKERLA
ncbi:MAG TPA: phage holin family protein [Methylomirabilota bacterium]|jgi:Putative Actinobacterial Holin-X, holin superfamily III|nr:phage holin family protein [Methylomirabilota bacterium]